MSHCNYDVVVVGARCAGATLAAFLARGGASVLMVDKSSLPSEHVASTHTLHPAGMRVLEQLGVAEALRTRAPAMRHLRLRKRDAQLVIDLRPEQFEYCPRRERLDGLLQDAARLAGAELRDRTRLVGVLRDGGRVCGVRLRPQHGSEYELRTQMVVGADGRHSKLAELVGAEEYLGYDAPRAMYWGYWPAPAGVPCEMYVGHYDGGIRVVFHTDDSNVLVGSLPARDEARSWRANPEHALRQDLRRDPYTAMIQLGALTEPVRGVIESRYFVRRAVGSGWALIGDAGLHKEFVTGDGMTEALLQARRLAAALLSGWNTDLREFWRHRDTDALPWFFWGQDQGALGSRPELEALVLRQLALQPALSQGIVGSLEHAVSPYQAVDPRAVVRWAVREIVRGKLALGPELLQAARRSLQIAKQIRRARAVNADSGNR